MLWVKALHIVFMVTWFAGLFYLPRLFIYHAQAEDEVSLRRFRVMERRLFAIMTIGALITIVLGAWLLIGWLQSLLAVLWMQLKLALVLGLAGYHYWCWRMIDALDTNPRRFGQAWLRWFNEVPAFFLVAIVLLAILKPTL